MKKTIKYLALALFLAGCSAELPTGPAEYYIYYITPSGELIATVQTTQPVNIPPCMDCGSLPLPCLGFTAPCYVKK